jgi:hypothetical protein
MNRWLRFPRSVVLVLAALVLVLVVASGVERVIDRHAGEVTL